MLILKTFFTDDAIPLHNSEFRKKKVPLSTKDWFSRGFQSCNFFHEKVSSVKKMEAKSNLIELFTFLKYGLSKVKKALS